MALIYAIKNVTFFVVGNKILKIFHSLRLKKEHKVPDAEFASVLSEMGET
jgi:hypothetical protein